MVVLKKAANKKKDELKKTTKKPNSFSHSLTFIDMSIL